MCSIGGWVSKDPLSEWQSIRLAQAFLYYGMDRGKQSAGVYANGRVLKAACDPLALSYKPEFSEMFKDGARICLTHTRMPTSGGLGDEQAQPFERPNTVTTHNGMYRNCAFLMEKHGLTKSAGVDSELAADFVETHGVKRITEFLKDALGSSALAIYRREPSMPDGRVYLIRDGNPLETLTLHLPGGNVVTAWGSTQLMVLSAMRYVWLVPSMHTKTLADKTLAIVRAKGILETHRRVPAWSPGPSHYPYGRQESRHHVSHHLPARRQETDDEIKERAELCALLDWKNDAGISLKTLRKKVRKKFGMGLVVSINKTRSALLDEYFTATRENREPTKEQREAYHEWRDELNDDSGTWLD